MAALGRILQIAGWLWVILGFAGSFFGFLSLSFLPGVILVFIARMIRTQAARQEIPELDHQGAEQQQPAPAPPERIMNTERQRRAERPAPEPAVMEPEPVEAPRKRNQLLEQIVSAGRDVTEEEMVPDLDEREELSGERKPMTSAEMIARAHERWDSKPR